MTCKKRRCRCGQHPNGLTDVGTSSFQPTPADIDRTRERAALYRARAGRHYDDAETRNTLHGMACVTDAIADRMEDD